MPRPKPDYNTALARILARCIVEPNGCHVWPGAVSGFGYPVANINGRNTFTYLHRAVFTRAGGIIPPEYEVDHACSNKRCLNPLHLQTLTHAENISREGTVGAPKKFSRQEARKLLDSGLSKAETARRLGVSRAAIQMFCRGNDVKPE